jgi:hypothetical protein
MESTKPVLATRVEHDYSVSCQESVLSLFNSLTLTSITLSFSDRDSNPKVIVRGPSRRLRFALSQ